MIGKPSVARWGNSPPYLYLNVRREKIFEDFPPKNWGNLAQKEKGELSLTEQLQKWWKMGI